MRSSGPLSRKPPPLHARTTFITTSDGVRLEVLDYGGRGAPILLVSGGGMTAHAFDDFAPRLTADQSLRLDTASVIGLGFPHDMLVDPFNINPLTAGRVDQIAPLARPVR